MGVLYDYFRAADDASAIKLIEDLVGGPAGNSSTVDAIDLKGIDPTVTLAELVCFVRGIEWNVNVVEEHLVWSRAEAEGPWVLSIGDDVRDALASITEAQMPSLSARWGRTEELAWHGPLPDDTMLPVIENISALARRARDAGDHLYCWFCV
ncbi:hypothetical protein GCM10010399_33220 [Dactylosporangium fulvum]|uniref:DUF1877 family protein n=1 Tax=Dactylosporangium fulvum TaxID=53359 RepID=A0ABY5W0B3_9ACTN|nr:hypothetical protein [Dactylosporangium fulvum]UWP82531.1 hypothetical protein Dfulv_47100 [Dactylosporangium fulvum]